MKLLWLSKSCKNREFKPKFKSTPRHFFWADQMHTELVFFGIRLWDARILSLEAVSILTVFCNNLLEELDVPKLNKLINGGTSRGSR